MGKILIKNKKGSHQKPTQTKKTAIAATEQTATTAAATQDPNTNSQDPANPAPSTQENQGGLDEHGARSDYNPKTGMGSYFLGVTDIMFTFNQRGTCLWRRMRSKRTQRNMMRRK